MLIHFKVLNTSEVVHSICLIAEDKHFYAEFSDQPKKHHLFKQKTFKVSEKTIEIHDTTEVVTEKLNEWLSQYRKLWFFCFYNKDWVYLKKYISSDLRKNIKGAFDLQSIAHDRNIKEPNTFKQDALTGARSVKAYYSEIYPMVYSMEDLLEQLKKLTQGSVSEISNNIREDFKRYLMTISAELFKKHKLLKKEVIIDVMNTLKNVQEKETKFNDIIRQLKYLD